MVDVAQQDFVLTSSGSSSLSSSLTTGLARAPRPLLRWPFPPRSPFSFRLSLIFTFTERAIKTHTHAPLTHFFCQKFGSGRNSSATHIQTLSLHLHLPPPLQIHLLHSHSPSQPFVSHLWRQTAARWNPHRSVTLVILKQLSHFKDSNI